MKSSEKPTAYLLLSAETISVGIKWSILCHFPLHPVISEISSNSPPVITAKQSFGLFTLHNNEKGIFH